MDTHIWNTEEEYQAQLDLPMHMDTVGLVDGAVKHGTVCGITYPPDEIVRSTSDATAVTCEACQKGL